MEKQGDRRPRDQVRGKVSRDMREEAREARDSTGCQKWVVRGRGEGEKERAVNVSQLEAWCAYLPVILHVVAQADEAGLEFLRPQCPAMVLPGGHRRQAYRGDAETRPRKWERGQATCSGQGRKTHGEGKHTVRGDVDKVVARD